MHADSWVQFLSEPSAITNLYDTPPDLSRCGISYLHIDERECSVTLRFDTPHLPKHPRPEWREKEFNTFQFYVQFDAVSRLRVSGWGAPSVKTVLIANGDDGGLQFSAQAPGSLLEFTASQAEVTRTHVYLASDAP